MTEITACRTCGCADTLTCACPVTGAFTILATVSVRLTGETLTTILDPFTVRAATERGACNVARHLIQDIAAMGGSATVDITVDAFPA